jgi:hypothetical protein
MALVIADRVKDSTTTTGTGTVTLSGTAPTGYQNFSVIGNTNTTYYCIVHQTANEWEVGIGTYASSGTTLARTTVLSNSSATQPSALSFSAGTKDVFVTYPSENSAFTGGSQGIVLNNATISANYTIATGVNGFSVGPITVGSGYAVTVTSGQRWLVL